MIRLDMTGFAERYKADPNHAVEKFAAEQGVSKPIVYAEMKRVGIKAQRWPNQKADKRPGKRWMPTAEDDRYIKAHYPTIMPMEAICRHLNIHHTVLKNRARHLCLQRLNPRKSSHYSAPGPKITTSDKAPIRVRFANVVQWLRAAGFDTRRDNRAGLWRVNGADSAITPPQVVQLANDARTRKKPNALPLFMCNYDSLKGL